MPHFASISDQIAGWSQQTGPILFYVVVWGLVFAGTGLMIGAFTPFITGDSLVFAAGVVAGSTASGVNIWVMAIGVGISAWLGDQVGFALGLHFGRPYLDKRKGAWLQRSIAKSEAFYAKWGWWAMVIGRFIPMVRALVPPIAGISKMNYYKFFSANLVGALTWGVGLTVAGYYAATIPLVKDVSYLIAAGFVAASIFVGVRSWLRNRKLK
ncbi:unannotated protein [freshwater metagenome]|uniref:Unannotated protein n=1 Tax=freshwater metagenome TaxID=449393 RepID=A0A6J7KX62_9ZZZZ|nr:DedA family protein [Actinomycetota bacterium]